MSRKSPLSVRSNVLDVENEGFRGYDLMVEHVLKIYDPVIRYKMPRLNIIFETAV
jgi:hypothetical protein